MTIASHILRQPPLILFARAPVPGQAKTRLQPEYTPAQAAEIAAFLMRATVELAAANWPGEVWLYGAPDAEHPLFRGLAEAHGLTLGIQRGADLGSRMANALRDGLRQRNAAAIMGCDVPHCRWVLLDQANEWLAQGRNVLGPTEDGGYYFIGLTRDVPELFAGIAWGTPQVLPQTLARATALGIEFEQLPPLTDIDSAADLWLAAQNYAPLRRFLSREAR